MNFLMDLCGGVSVGLYVKKQDFFWEFFFYDFLGLQLFKCVYVAVKNTFGYFFFFLFNFSL